MLLILDILGSRVARLSFSVVAIRCLKSMEFVVLNLLRTLELIGWVRPLSVVFSEFFGIPCSWNDAFAEIFEFVSSCPGLHPDSLGSLPIGGEFSLFRILLVTPEDEVANFEFSFHHFFAVTNSYFLL